MELQISHNNEIRRHVVQELIANSRRLIVCENRVAHDDQLHCGGAGDDEPSAVATFVVVRAAIDHPVRRQQYNGEDVETHRDDNVVPRVIVDRLFDAGAVRHAYDRLEIVVTTQIHVARMRVRRTV